MVNPIPIPRTIAKVELPKEEKKDDRLECLIVAGMPCTGKTAKIKSLFEFSVIEPEKAVIVSYDEILYEYMEKEYGITDPTEAYYKAMKNRQPIDELFNEAVIKAQKENKNIIIDVLAISPRWRKEITDLISDDFKILLLYLISSYRKRKERNKKRDSLGGKRYRKSTIHNLQHIEIYPVPGENDRFKDVSIFLNEADSPILEGVSK